MRPTHPGPKQFCAMPAAMAALVFCVSGHSRAQQAAADALCEPARRGLEIERTARIEGLQRGFAAVTQSTLAQARQLAEVYWATRQSTWIEAAEILPAAVRRVDHKPARVCASFSAKDPQACGGEESPELCRVFQAARAQRDGLPGGCGELDRGFRPVCLASAAPTEACQDPPGEDPWCEELRGLRAGEMCGKESADLNTNACLFTLAFRALHEGIEACDREAAPGMAQSPAMPVQRARCRAMRAGDASACPSFVVDPPQVRASTLLTLSPTGLELLVRVSVNVSSVCWVEVDLVARGVVAKRYGRLVERYPWTLSDVERWALPPEIAAFGTEAQLRTQCFGYDGW